MRRWFKIMGYTTILATCLLLMLSPTRSFAGTATVPPRNSPSGLHPVEALFITEYVCGNPKIEKKVVYDMSQVAFSTVGPPWHIDKGITLSTSIPVFRRTVRDIAPELKGHLFFGMDNVNRLVVYDGLPEHGHVVKQYEAMDLEKMKRGLPQGEIERLKKGIRVDSIDDYSSILSTFSEYFVRK